MRFLTCIGNAADADTWSGIPFFFLQAGKRARFLDGGWSLQPDRLRAHRLLWNIKEYFTTGERGGFQYTRAFLDRLHTQAPRVSDDTEIISHFSLFPPHQRTKARVSYYIDATQAQIFEDYGIGARVSSRVVRDACLREREHYERADRIVCMSRWAAQDVVLRYGINPEKVHIIPGGANLDEGTVLPAGCADDVSLRPLRLGFVGKDWKRKGLSVILTLADALHRRGYPVEVWAAGFSPASGPRHPLLRAVGFIDKRRGTRQFVEFVRGLHFGCLFPSAEASPRSNLECLRLGVPVLSRDVGGVRDTLPDGLGHLFHGSTTADEMADVLEAYFNAPGDYLELRARVAARASEFSWDSAVNQFVAVWDGRAPDPCPTTERERSRR